MEKVPREIQGESFFRTFFCTRHLSFSVALGQHGRSCFNSHSFFTSFLHALLPPVSPGTSSRPNRTPSFFFSPRGWSRRVLGSAMNYLFANIHWEEHPRIPVNVFRFSTQSDLPSSFHPFPRAFARTKIGISWLLAGWASGKKKTPKEGNALSHKSRITRFIAA